MLIYMLGGLLLAGVIFVTVRETGNFLVWRYYMSDEARERRSDEYLSEFQEYVDENRLFTFDSDKIGGWTEDRHIDLVLYEDEKLIYTPEKFEDGKISEENDAYTNILSGDRGFQQYLTEEARAEYERTLQNILDGNQYYTPIVFRDGTLLATVVDYSDDFMYNIVLMAGLGAAAVVLLVVMTVFMTREVGRITKLAKNVRLVGSGNTDLPIASDGNDEISELASDVNRMRNAVVDNMSKEREAWEANTGLITAMSHDIRTPLTVLLGYLDLMELQNGDGEIKEYVNACRENAMRLKKLSDDLFSYFLVFGKRDVELELISCRSDEVPRHMIDEHILLLSEKGYRVEQIWDISERAVTVDTLYFGRVIDNIFSNIGKYADKNEPVRISAEIRQGELALCFSNRISKTPMTESNGIGTKTCAKIMEQMRGSFEYSVSDNIYTAMLRLPVTEG